MTNFGSNVARNPSVSSQYEPAAKKLLIPVEEVAADESLLGILARGLDANRTSRVGAVLKKIGINPRPETLPILYADRAVDVAKLLGIGIHEIERRFYPSVPSPPGELQTISFFGAHIPAVFREPALRRVSPEALNLHGRHLALWELRPFTFDPGTMQLLIDRCQNPACMKFLRWRHARGVHICEHCHADIRGFDTCYVDPADQEACLFAADVVSPLRGRREKTYAALPLALREWNAGAILDLIVRLSFLHDPRIVAVNGQRSWSALSRGNWSSADLARGATVLLGWPESFHLLMDRLRGEAHTRFRSYGVSKELGSVAAFINDFANPLTHRKFVRDEVEKYYRSLDDVLLRAPGGKANGEAKGFYTMSCTASSCGIPVRMVRRLLEHPDCKVIRASSVAKSPFMFHLGQVSAWNERRLELIGAGETVKMLGIPEYTLLHLAELGVLTREVGPAAIMMGGHSGSAWLERSGVVEFANRLQQLGPRRTRPPVGSIALVDLLAVPMGLTPWNDIVDALLDNRLIVRAVLPGSANVASRLFVDQYHNLGNTMVLPAADYIECEPDALISTKGASHLLGTSETAISWLLIAGLIKSKMVGKNRRRAFRKSVFEFRRDYMLGGEVCKITGINWRRLSISLGKLGISPVAVLQDSKRTVWLRSSIEAVCPRSF